MAYLGRKGASAALTSADIPDGSISAVKVAADVATQAEIDLKANLASPTLVTPTIADMSNCTFPDGHILQCVVSSKTSKSTTSNNTPTSTGLTLSITPSDTTNKIFIQALVGGLGLSVDMGRVHVSISGGTSQSTGDAATGFESGATWSPRANDAWHQGAVCFGFLDAPNSTSAQTYTLNFWRSSEGTAAINSSYNNDQWVGNNITTLTAWEIVD